MQDFEEQILRINKDAESFLSGTELVPFDLPLFYRMIDSRMEPWARHGRCAHCGHYFEFCPCWVNEGLTLMTLEVRG